VRVLCSGVERLKRRNKPCKLLSGEEAHNLLRWVLEKERIEEGERQTWGEERTRGATARKNLIACASSTGAYAYLYNYCSGIELANLYLFGLLSFVWFL